MSKQHELMVFCESADLMHDLGWGLADPVSFDRLMKMAEEVWPM